MPVAVDDRISGPSSRFMSRFLKRKKWVHHRVHSGAVIASILGMGVLLTACSSSPSATKSSSVSAVTTIKFPVIPPSITDVFMPLYAANTLGIGKQNGIHFSFDTVDSGSALETAVVAGVTPFSFIPISTFAEALADHANLQALAPTQPLSAGFILESKAGSGITSVKQLAGKTICVSEAGSETDLFAEYVNSVDHLGATIVPVGASGQEPSLLTGKTAACVEAAPQSYQLLTQKKAVELVNFAKVAPIYGVLIAIAGYEFSHKKVTTELVKTWMETLAKLKNDEGLSVRELESVNGESPSIAKSEYENEFADAPTNGAVTPKEVSMTYAVLRAANVTHLAPESAIETNLFANING